MQEAKTDRRLIILAVFVLLAAGVVAAVLISRDGGESSESPSGSTTAAGCRQVEVPKPKHVSYEAPGQLVKGNEKLTAIVQTSCGTFDIALDTKRAPKTVGSFVFLASNDFYNGLTFHRVAPDFVIQGGDPLGNGTGGPGYSVDEKPPANLSYTRGTVAMAKSAAEPPGRSGSQFFIVLGADAGLPPEYALLGKVNRGLNVVERIGKLGTPQETPSQTVLIERVLIQNG